MIKAAIVGLGWWGKRIVDSVQGHSDRLRFVHGVSKERDAAREVTSRHGLRFSGDLDVVLAADDVQAVVLATPHSLHVEQIVACARAGKHVLCEKPLALGRAGALHAVAECRRAGVVLGLGTNRRFLPSMRELRRIVASGALGQLLHVEGNFSNANSSTNYAPWRASEVEAPAGGMTSPGIHMLDALVSIAGPMREVCAQLATQPCESEPHDAVSVLIRHVTGVSASFSAVRPSPMHWRVHAFGTAASVEAAGECDVVLHRGASDFSHLRMPAVNSILENVNAFADAVAGAAAYPVTTDEMVDVVAAFEAVVASVKEGRTVAVAPTSHL